MPAKQEPHEVLRGDRFDLPPQPFLVYMWMRARSRRAHHCSPTRAGSKWPVRANPSCSRRARPMRMSPSGNAVALARSAASPAQARRGGAEHRRHERIGVRRVDDRGAMLDGTPHADARCGGHDGRSSLGGQLVNHASAPSIGRVTTSDSNKSCSSSASRRSGRPRPHPLDRVGIERGQIPGVDRQPATQTDGPAAALLERGVVKKGVRPPVENLVRQRRRLVLSRHVTPMAPVSRPLINSVNPPHPWLR